MTRRREFLKGAALGAGLLALRASADEKKPAKPGAAGDDEDVSPAEDLMREHGVLKRVFLVYREALRRLEGAAELPPEPVAEAADVIRTFIEDYHEKLEEEFLFPRFRKAKKEVGLVDVLQAQHAAGRRLTDATLRLAKGGAPRSVEERRAWADPLAAFVRMYEPHEAREDTILFPAFRRIVSAHEWDALGDDFEKREHQLFGGDGFEKMVDRVASIEKRLGIYDLSQFTPKA